MAQPYACGVEAASGITKAAKPAAPDGITGLMSRGAFEAALAQVLDTDSGTGTPW